MNVIYVTQMMMKVMVINNTQLFVE